MRPQLIAADNKGARQDRDPGRGASMRPQLIAADNARIVHLEPLELAHASMRPQLIAADNADGEAVNSGAVVSFNEAAAYSCG